MKNSSQDKEIEKKKKIFLIQKKKKKSFFALSEIWTRDLLHSSQAFTH